MQRRVEAELADEDGVLFVLDAQAGVGGPGDRWIAEALGGAGKPVTIAVNKVDRLDRPRTVLALDAAAALEADLGLDAEIFPVSATTGAGMRALVDHLVARLPEGPFFFPEDEVTDLPGSVWIAEIVREQVLHRTRQEVPHAVEVQVEEVEDRGDAMLVRAAIWVETDSQKGILIGAGGRMIKAIGTSARQEAERELVTRVHLELSVRVRRSWRADEAALDRLGIT
jgi:GTPase